MVGRQKRKQPVVAAASGGGAVLSGFVINRDNAQPVPVQVANHIEQQIRSGTLRPGTRLPSTAELAALAGVAPVTMQHSLVSLVRGGLLERAPRRGTFVSAAVQAHNLALVFGDRLLVSESPFYRLLYAALRRNADKFGFSITAHHISYENAHIEISRLEANIAAGQVDAILPVSSGSLFARWVENVKTVPWFSSLWTDESEGMRIGVEYLLRRGFRSIAVVTRLDWTHPPGGIWRQSVEAEMAGLRAACEAVGVKPSAISVFHWGMHTREGYEGAKRLFARRADRPKALFINHDVITKGALVGLAEMGVRFPKDIALLTHANEGDDFPTPCPLSRVEVDVNALACGLFQQLASYRGRLRMGMVSPKPLQVARLVPGASCGETARARTGSDKRKH